MRKDSLPVLDSSGEKSNLEKIRDDAVVYENAVAPAPWTIPSHVSMFTGKYPSEHAIHETREIKGRDILRLRSANHLGTLQEDLRKIGYSAVGVSANQILFEGISGLGGFNYLVTLEEEYRMWPNNISGEEREEWQKYVSDDPMSIPVKNLVTGLAKHGRFREIRRLYSIQKRLINRGASRNYPLVKNGDRVTRSVIAGRLEEPFYLFLNFLEMHEPYTDYELSRFNRENVLDLANFGMKPVPGPVFEEMKLRYRLGAAQLDAFVGQLIRHWKEAGVYNESLIVVTSDHGQEFMEQGYIGHGTFLHDEILRVPLMVKFPHNEKVTPSEGYQSLTNLPLLIKRVAEGESYRDELTSEYAFSEAFGISWFKASEIADTAVREKIEKVREKTDKSRKAVYWNGYKLAVNWDERVIEEFSQNGKKLNLLERKDVLGELQNRLEEFAKKEATPPSVASDLTSEEEADIEARLKSLGYV
jgi:hypothetical protein